jgi:non-ribosomal peptide synthase protein (TIGR01720 family)
MLTAHVARLNGSLNLTHGPVVKLTYFDLGPERAPRMLVSAHWLVMDYYSSRVFYEDLRIAYAQLELGAPIELPPTTAPLAVCHARLAERAVEITGDVGLWTSLASAEVTPLPRDVTPESSSPAADVNLQGDADRVFQLINPDEAAPILALAGRDGVEVRDVLLTALLAAVTDWAGGDTLYAELEGFGREAAFGAVDTSRTIARFSTLSPALLRRDPAASPGAALRSVRDQLRAIPEHGVGYGLLRYLHPDAEVRAALRAIPAPEVGFNYWGDVTEYFAEGSAPTEEAFGGHRGAAGHRWRVLDLMALVMDGAIGLVWTYGTRIHRRETVEALADGFHRHLSALAAGTTTLPNATREDTSR